MKTLNYKIVLFLFLLGTISCQDELNIGDDSINQVNLEDSVAPGGHGTYNLWSRASNANPRYDGSDSGPIDLVKAEAWIGNFNKLAATGGVMSHYFDRTTLNKILSQQGCTGLRIHHAVNNEGKKDLVITGVSNKGLTLYKITMASISPTSSGKSVDILGEVDETRAKAWVGNYVSNAAPDQIRSHYFGQNILRKIMAQKGCAGIRVYYALTESYENKLIITGTDENGDDILPNSSTVVEGDNILADFSFPCPSVCPGDDDDDDGGN